MKYQFLCKRNTFSSTFLYYRIGTSPCYVPLLNEIPKHLIWSWFKGRPLAQNAARRQYRLAAILDSLPGAFWLRSESVEEISWQITMNLSLTKKRYMINLTLHILRDKMSITCINHGKFPSKLEGTNSCQFHQTRPTGRVQRSL